MATNENLPGFLRNTGSKTRPARSPLHPLHEAAMRIADIGMGRSKPGSSKTKDLIGVLLCHGARAWRYSQPEAVIHLHVTSPSGQAPVLLRLR